MGEKILEYIWEHLHKNPFLIVLAVVAYFVTRDIFKRLSSLDTDMGDLEDDVDSIKSDTTGIKTQLSSLITCLATKNFINKDVIYFKSESPMQLTNEGWSMLKDSGLVRIIDENKELLFNEVKAYLDDLKEPTEYDVEKYATEVMIVQGLDDLGKPSKEYAFQNGMNYDLMLTASGIYLRDLYLKEAFKK